MKPPTARQLARVTAVYGDSQTREAAQSAESGPTTVHFGTAAGPVVIIGAGIAGLTCAATWARKGQSVVVLEAAREIKRHVCGEYLCPSGVTVARKLGVEGLLDGFAPIKGMVVVGPGGDAITCDFPRDGRHGDGVAVDKGVFTHRLARWARSEGVDLRFGTRVKSIEAIEGGWTLHLEDGDRIDTPFLVGADGRRSMVAHTLGLTQASRSERVAIRGFVEAKGPRSNRGEMHVLGDEAYLGINPIGPGEVNVSICLEGSTLKALGGPEATFRHFVARSPRLQEHWDWSTLRDVRGVFPITHRVSSSVADRAALIGDAGGFFDPLTGEGMSVALWTATELVERVAGPVAASDPSAIRRALRGYGRIKHAHFRQKLVLSRFFQFVIRRPRLADAIGRWLSRSERRRRGFIGAIGNNYSTIEAIFVALGLRKRHDEPWATPREMEAS